MPSTPQKARFWYSERQKHCHSLDPELNPDPVLRHCAAMLHELKRYMPEEKETRAFITLPIGGEMVELEYTEMSHDPDYWPNWPDAILLGEADYLNAPIRIEEIGEIGHV
jgi:hypothetical protein